jgi:hypothetical protein
MVMGEGQGSAGRGPPRAPELVVIVGGILILLACAAGVWVLETAGAGRCVAESLPP